MSTRTPGPWRVQPASEPIDVKTTAFITTVGPSTLSRHPRFAVVADTTVDGDAEADACLIAAAPDLLAAAAAAEQAIREWRPGSALPALASAIAKARGGA